MAENYTPDQVAIIRANAAAADLQRQLEELPIAVIPEGNLMPDGKRTRRSVQFAYEANGGDLKLAIWAKDNWGEFITKVWVKTIDKQFEVNDKRSIEDVLDYIDNESKNAVDAEFEPMVEPEQ